MRLHWWRRLAARSKASPSCRRGCLTILVDRLISCYFVVSLQWGDTVDGKNNLVEIAELVRKDGNNTAS